MSKALADELHAGGNRLETLAANTSTVVWHTAPDGTMALSNASWGAFTGQSSGKYRGRGWLAAVHPEDRESVALVWRTAAQTKEQFETTYRLRRHDGEYRNVRAQGTPLFQGSELQAWVGVCIDVTSAREMELASRRSELRFRFLDQVGQATRALTDAGEVMQVTARLLGEYLGASRCAYADVDPASNRFIIRSDWAASGIDSSAGSYSLEAFGPKATMLLGRGDCLVLRDVDAELGDNAGARMFNAIGVKAIICAGLVKDGRLQAMMAIHQAQPRNWSEQEVALVQEVVERCWTHIERVRDISQRQNALAELQASRLKLEMGIQAAGLVMAEIDYRSDVNHISAELARLLELGDGAIVVPRSAIFDRIHPQDRERYLQAIARTTDPASHGHLAVDVRVLLPSGVVRWLHIRLQVIFSLIDGQLQPDRGICAARDVTAELMAERRLQEAQRLAESVIEGAGALVYAKDLQGRYILSNQAWRELLGFTFEQVQGLTDEKIYGARAAAAVRENDLKVARAGQRLLMEERVVLRGKRVTFRSSKFPLYDESGEIYAVCGVSTDITDVAEADRRKDEFIATLAHELRNPLAPIRNALEILKLTAALPPSAARMRDIMDRQLTHMVRLVDDLLDVSRITRDKLEMKIRPVALQEIVEHAVEASRPVIDAAAHMLAVDLPAQPIMIEGDLTRLAQVVSNLLNNAAKYTPPSGRIELAARVDGAEVAVTVTDNGSGISEEMLAHVFDLFSQVDRTIDRSQGGLGIGLWLVKKLVELHRGRLEVHSEPGRGSTFTLRLPVLASP
ncbi:MAG: PAS domain-containing protein [Ramlibacter sp.]|nr:PAS domain-containing protein [Ramlibacter sp.]